MNSTKRVRARYLTIRPMSIALRRSGDIPEPDRRAGIWERPLRSWSGCAET